MVLMKKKPDDYWKDKLSDEQYNILRGQGTEAPFSGTLLQNKDKGTYKCAACGANLFSSDKKYDSKSGWPSFYQAIGDGVLELKQDNSHGMKRTEVICAQCGGHLGHLFEDGPSPTGMRYCINSVSLEFKGEDDD